MEIYPGLLSCRLKRKCDDVFFIVKSLLIQLSWKQMSPLKDFLFIPVLVATQSFGFSLIFIPSDNGDQNN